MKKYKIGIVTPTFPPKGGGIATAHYNIYQLLKEKHDVRVFAYNDEPEKNEHEVIKRKTPNWILPFIDLFLTLYLKRYKQNVKYINVTRIFHCSIGAWLLNGPIKKFSPDILIIPDNNIPLYWIKKGKYKIAWFTRNNYLRFRDNPLITNYSWIDIDIACSMERKAIRKADIILSPSEYMIEEYNRAFNYNHDITVINNFIFKKKVYEITDSFGQRTALKKAKVFMPSAGTINKGSRYTFEIIRRISKALNNSVDFCITGPIVGELEYELQYLNKNVTFETPGHVNWEKNLNYLNACTIVISPTLIENFSNAFVEAFVLGKPIITFDVGGNKEIVDDGFNGFIVPYLDIDQLILRAIELLKNNDLIQLFSKRAQVKAEKFCDENKLISQYSALFKKLAQHG